MFFFLERKQEWFTVDLINFNFKKLSPHSSPVYKHKVPLINQRHSSHGTWPLIWETIGESL